MNRQLNRLADLFPPWVRPMSGLALFFPQWISWFGGPMIVWSLAIIMIGMGIPSTFDDFRRWAKLPRATVIGFIAQFCIAHARQGHRTRPGAQPGLAVSLILMACCPRGTASNVVSSTLWPMSRSRC